MRNTKAILLVLWASLILMGVGAGAWTDEMIVNTSISTGDFNVSFLPEACYFSLDEMNGSNIGDETDYIKEVILDEKSIKLKLENFFPGIWLQGNFVMKNLGTIPAVFDDQNSNVTFHVYDEENHEITQSEQGKKVLDAFVFDNFFIHVHNEEGDMIQEMPIIETGEFDTSKMVKLSDLEEKLKKSLVNLKLNPGESIALRDGDEGNGYFWLIFDDQTSNETQNKKVIFTISLNWKQFNQ